MFLPKVLFFSLVIAISETTVVPGSAAKGYMPIEHVAQLGFSTIISDPDNVRNTTFYGGFVSGGWLVDEHHQFTFEFGGYAGDRDIYVEWGNKYYRERYERDTYLFPLLLTYNYVQKLGSEGEFSIFGGPTGGLFISVDSQRWGNYDHKRKDTNWYINSDEDDPWFLDFLNHAATYDDGWRSKTHNRFRGFWGAGANIGLSWQFTRNGYLDLGYRFLYAGSYETLGIKTGQSRNHQITLAAKVNF
jgi:hypothetical protein